MKFVLIGVVVVGLGIVGFFFLPDGQKREQTPNAPAQQIQQQPQAALDNRPLPPQAPSPHPDHPEVQAPVQPAYDAAKAAAAKTETDRIFAAARAKGDWTMEDTEAYAKVMATIPVSVQEPIAAERDKTVAELMERKAAQQAQQPQQ